MMCFITSLELVDFAVRVVVVKDPEIEFETTQIKDSNKGRDQTIILILKGVSF